MSATALQSEDWIPRDDMATLTRTSVDTVRRDCKKHKFTLKEDQAGRALVNVGDFLNIDRLRPEDLALGGTPAESAEVLRARDTVTALKVQVAELTGRLSHSDALVDTLREQLTTKDKQLGKQADQVTQLIGRLGSQAGAA